MASKLEYVEYVCEQMSGAGEITYKKMFGEFGLYCNGKIIGLICNDQVFIKPTKAGEALMQLPEMESPYNGAKPHFVLTELDDRDFISEFIKATYDELPIPKPKKKKE